MEMETTLNLHWDKKISVTHLKNVNNAGVVSLSAASSGQCDVRRDGGGWAMTCWAYYIYLGPRRLFDAESQYNMGQ